MTDPQEHDLKQIVDNCAKMKCVFVTSIDAWVACGYDEAAIVAVLRYAQEQGVTVQVVPNILPPLEIFNVYLDDMRPAPDGWKLCKTLAEVKALLETNQVENLSLDHDLGSCDACLAEFGVKDAEEWLAKTGFKAMPNCEHIGTGYDLCCWMEETGHWPRQRPVTHTANPAGRMRMRAVIEKHYGA